jgi:hypothetical protein
MATDHLITIDPGTSAIKLMMSRTLDIVATKRIASSALDSGTWIDAIRQRSVPLGDASNIAAVVVTGQMHGLVPEVGTGFGKGMPWTDQRGATVLPELSAHGVALPGSHALGWIDIDGRSTTHAGTLMAATPDSERHRRYSELYDIHRDTVTTIPPISHRLVDWRRSQP